MSTNDKPPGNPPSMTQSKDWVTAASEPFGYGTAHDWDEDVTCIICAQPIPIIWDWTWVDAGDAHRDCVTAKRIADLEAELRAARASLAEPAKPMDDDTLDDRPLVFPDPSVIAHKVLIEKGEYERMKARLALTELAQKAMEDEQALEKYEDVVARLPDTEDIRIPLRKRGMLELEANISRAAWLAAYAAWQEAEQKEPTNANPTR